MQTIKTESRKRSNCGKNCGIEPPVNISDTMEIMKYGVMSTPALVIDGKVVATGRMLSVEQIEELIKKN